MHGTYLDILPETRGVVVTRRLGVTERLEDGVGSQNLALDLAGLIQRCLGLSGFGSGRIDRSEITHDELGLEEDEDVAWTDKVRCTYRFRLSSTTRRQ